MIYIFKYVGSKYWRLLDEITFETKLELDKDEFKHTVITALQRAVEGKENKSMKYFDLRDSFIDEMAHLKMHVAESPVVYEMNNCKFKEVTE